ncbi:MAG: response regulator [Microbacterium sp.]|uniref:response regulator n=1 Tax=Microbacterium sp. TaxID=51671 RepID=UPI0039E5A94F
MSTEVLTMLGCTATVLIATMSGFGWLVMRMDRKFERVDERFDAQARELGDRITGVERELIEVKIALARLEGPPRRLLSAR